MKRKMGKKTNTQMKIGRKKYKKIKRHAKSRKSKIEY